MKRKRKALQVLVVVLLSIILCLGIILQPLNVLGAPYDFGNGTSVQEIQQAINNDLKYYNSLKIRQQDSNASILYNFRTMLKLGTWVDALTKLNHKEKGGQPIISFPSEVVNYQANRMLELIETFNKAYNKETPNHKPVLIAETSVTTKNFSYGQMVSDIRSYLVTYMDSLLAENSNIDELVKTHKKEIKYLYYVCTAPTEIGNKFNAIMPQKVDETGAMGGEGLFTYTINDSLYNLTTNDKYKSLIAKGKELSQSDLEAITSGDPDVSKDLIELFLTDVKESGDSITYSNVSELWYLYFSLSSTYQPFTTKAGDDKTLEVLNLLTGNKTKDSTKYGEIYRKAIRYKKPLYMIEVDKKGELTGAASSATLQKFIDSVERKKEGGALVLPIGKLAKGKDDNSYYYYKGKNLFKPNSDNKEDSDKEEDNIDTSEKVETLGNAASEITDKSALSDPVVKWGFTKNKDLEANSGTLNMTSVVMNNILQSVSNIDKFKPTTALLYMNVFGDVVLEDGTVILPGAANPTFYNEGTAYYPYTMSFIQNYPNLSESKTFKVNDSKAEGKMILYSDIKTDEDVAVNGADFTQTDLKTIKTLEVTGEDTVAKIKSYVATHSLDGTLYDLDEAPSSLFSFVTYNFDSKSWLSPDWISNLDTTFYDRKYMRKVVSGIGDNGVLSLFTSDPSSLESNQLAVIAKNYYVMSMTDADGDLATVPSKRFNKDLIARGTITEVLNGLTNTEGYVNYRQTKYEELVEAGSKRFTVMVTGLLKDFVAPLYDVEGVIGIENAFQSDIFSTVVSYGRTYMLFIMIGILIGLIFKFVRGNNDLLKTAIMTVVTLSMCWGFITIVPIYLPMVFNGALSIATADNSNELGYLTLMMRMEDYDATYNTKTDSKGNQITNTSTINLYKFTDADLRDLAEDAKIPIESILQGEPVILDYESGIYIEGNVLKCSLDSLFVNNPITGSYEARGAGKYYTLKSQKTASSMIDYYTPYHLIVDALVDKLNAFNVVFPANREFINYGGLQKDSFTMINYISSIPFLKPTEPDLIGEQYSLEIQDAAVSYMGDFTDTFGLHAMFNNLNDLGRNTLWFKTIQQSGKLDEKYMNTVIEKTTNVTKHFLIKNYDRLRYMSDENIIKITALYMTTSLSRQLGVPGNEIYPQHLNIEEFKLKDVLISSYVSDREQFRYKDLEIISYMVDNFGAVWGIVFSLSILVSYLILNITKYVIPILYIALGLLLLFRFITEGRKHELVKGYLTGTILIFTGYLVHIFMLILASNLIDSVTGFIIPLVVNFTILEMLVRYILTVFKNPLDLGGKFGFESISPWIANKVGITSATIAVRDVLNGAFEKGQRGREYAEDAYAKYRDMNAYDVYTGQAGVIKEVMRKQEKHRPQREYHIKNTMNSVNNDPYSSYRE